MHFGTITRFAFIILRAYEMLSHTRPLVFLFVPFAGKPDNETTDYTSPDQSFLGINFIGLTTKIASLLQRNAMCKWGDYARVENGKEYHTEPPTIVHNAAVEEYLFQKPQTRVQQPAAV